jgi:ubiquinone/menaquinone biosynthesis C-methylase UbiE
MIFPPAPVYALVRQAKTLVSNRNPPVRQCQQPTGWLGRFLLWQMNSRHSLLTDWGLAHISVEPHFTVLDVGCGGGRTIHKLAVLAKQGKVYGIDYSDASVAASRRFNAQAISAGHVEIRNASISQLPFPDNTFDLVTGVETHFWWSDLPHDLREIFRVLRPRGTLLLIAEIYKGANTAITNLAEKHSSRSNLKLLTLDEHRELLVNSGYSNVQIIPPTTKGWVCAVGSKA